MLAYNKIFENLWLRKSYHLIGGLFILIALALFGSNFIAPGIMYLIFFWALGKRLSFAMLGILLVLSLTHSTFVTMGAVIVFWIGDGAAAIVGTQYGSKKWGWQKDKSLIGSLAFFMCATSALLLFFWSQLHLMSGAVCVLACVTALVGAAAEIAPIALVADRKPDDNLLILVSSGLMLLGVSQLCGISIPPG